MPFSFSQFVKRGKTGNPYTDDESRKSSFTSRGVSRQATANSYDFRPNPAPAPAPVPAPVVRPPPRTSSRVPPSSFPTHKLPPSAPRAEPPVPTYDNGNGRLSPEFIEQTRLPPTVQTTVDLAEYIKARGWEDQVRPESSASNYSYTSTNFSYKPHSRARTTAGTMPRVDSGYEQDYSAYTQGPYTPSPPRVSSNRSHAAAPARSIRNDRGAYHPSVAAARNLYVPPPIVRVALPGNMRQDRFEGFWFDRGSLRGLQNAKKEKKAWRKNCGGKMPVERGTFAPQDFDKFKEVSEWYDSDED